MATDIDQILSFQHQLAESAAIRRAYGWTFFKNPMANGMVDTYLWFYYRMKKILSRLLFQAR